VYQETFSERCPQITDDAYYHRAMVEAGACWHIFHTIDRLHSALALDPATPLHQKRMLGPSTLRQQTLAWTEAFANLAEEKNGLPTFWRIDYAHTGLPK
jgi:hypothetical protein